MNPALETERLILRPVDPEHDFDAWAAAMADADTMRYLGAPPMSRSNAWRNMCMVMGHWQVRGYGFFSVILKETGEWVGRVGPWFPEGWPEPEIGWTIAPTHLRRGYAIEAARASLDFAFNTLGWKRVIHVIMPGNEGSIAVAEKLGSSFLKEIPGLVGLTDERLLVYGQTRPAASS